MPGKRAWYNASNQMRFQLDRLNPEIVDLTLRREMIAGNEVKLQVAVLINCRKAMLVMAEKEEPTGEYMTKEDDKNREEKLEMYDRLIATNPNIERKGATMPYTSLNGHMFTYFSKSNSLGIRLPREEREAFLEKYDTILLESYGAIMKEYVTVPEDLLANTEELRPYLDISFEYVKTLKPKPTKKKS
jgi:hypothetical protein